MTFCDHLGSLVVGDANLRAEQSEPAALAERARGASGASERREQCERYKRGASSVSARASEASTFLRAEQACGVSRSLLL